MLDKNVMLNFKNPIDILIELKNKYNCYSVHLLGNYLKGAKSKADRELFYSALFGESLNKISKHKYMIYTPIKEMNYDFQLLNYTEWQKNQILSKNNRNSDHFFVENVSITSHVVEREIRKGCKNIYEIFEKHLYETKLSPESGDYSGYILVFYISLKIKGKLRLNEIRYYLRKVKQDKFQQIWIIIPNRNKYGIAELLISNDQFVIADFNDI